jgi:DNA-directed RNA polymerase specialized sigma24 family protein
VIDTYRAGAAQDAARRELRLPAIVAGDGDLDRIDELAGCTEQLTVALSQLPDAERRAVIERIARGREYDELAQEASQPEYEELEHQLVDASRRLSSPADALRAYRGANGRAVNADVPPALLTFARSVYVAFVVARSSLVTR